MLKNDILRELKNADRSAAIPGPVLAEKYHVSRNAVWKAVKSLQNDGFNIVTEGRKGYVLKNSSDFLSKKEIISWMRTGALTSDDIYIYDELESTNREALHMTASGVTGPALVLAEKQTKGRGHGGSDFPSPASAGLYMTLIMPVNVKIEDSVIISKAAAAAVIDSLPATEKNECGIRAVNSIYRKGRKICGILTEAVSSDLESGTLSEVCIGIGLYSDDPRDRNRTAASICDSLLAADFDHPRNILGKYSEYYVS